MQTKTKSGRPFCSNSNARKASGRTGVSIFTGGSSRRKIRPAAGRQISGEWLRTSWRAARPGAQLAVTVTFTGQYNAALNVSFSLFDIDNGPDREKIVNIYGLLSDGVTKVAPSVTVQNPGTVSLTGSGLTQTLTGNVASPDTGVNSSNGNATFNFGNTAIGSFSFDFKNEGGAPRFQAIALYDITFTPVPEVNPAISGGVACIFAVLITLRMQRRRRT